MVLPALVLEPVVVLLAVAGTVEPPFACNIDTFGTPDGDRMGDSGITSCITLPLGRVLGIVWAATGSGAALALPPSPPIRNDIRGCCCLARLLSRRSLVF